MSSHESMETFDASSATTETENPSSIGHFDNFPESLGENNEDSTTPVLLTNNPLSIEFSELSNNDISSKLQSIKITNISSNTPFNDKGLLSNTMEERTEHNFLSDITNNEQINFENSSSTDLGSSYPLDQSKQVNKESKNKIKWKKVKREKDLCFYCDSEVLNFARHLLRNHSSEIEVQKIASLPSNDLRRKRLITEIRKRGNHIKNIDKCIKPMKKSYVMNADSKYIPCKHCVGYYKSDNLWRHVKKCTKNEGGKVPYSHLANSQSVLVSHLPIDEELRSKVFPRMFADKISLEAKSDLLICKFGSRYLRTHRERHHVNVCSRKMREISKLLIEVKV
ncbi:hypothetical protein JTB14_006864 [Gonioctena quinquepunctata]|nr:hypothetical protein JTB14_006864 [Gonioctena quinquepunctata]